MMKLELINFYRAFFKVVSAGSFLTRRFIARAARKKPADETRVCLDVGAGNALYQKEISWHFSVGYYLALDFTASSAVGVIADARSLPIREKSIDLVVCLEVVQHIGQYHVLLDEITRVLRPEGRLIISFPFIYAECGVVDFQRWTIMGMTQELTTRGFSILAVERRGGAAFAAMSFLIWAIQHMVPGARATWRSPRTAAAYCREGLLAILTLPVLLLGWLAIALDRLLPPSGCYVGALVFASLTPPAAFRRALADRALPDPQTADSG